MKFLIEKSFEGHNEVVIGSPLDNRVGLTLILSVVHY